jgi:hypothetical protein
VATLETTTLRQLGSIPVQMRPRGESINFICGIDQFRPIYILTNVSKLTKAMALVVLVLWGLAVMHCKLEALPGFGFLKSCCFADSAPSSPKNCESDGCGAVEDGGYRAEEQNAAAPQPLLFLVLNSRVMEEPSPETLVVRFSESHAPPELSQFWQFSYRAALPPRAPSLDS